METQAAIMWEPGGKWSVETITLDPPKAGEVLVEMVASGLGVAVIPLSSRGLAKLSGLTCLPFAAPQAQRTVVLLEREDRPAGRLAAALADAIRLQAGDEAINEKNLS